MVYIHDLNPVLLQLGPVRIMWYGMMYVLAFVSSYVWLNRKSVGKDSLLDADGVSSLVLHLLLGIVLGGRVGWILFYGGGEFLSAPWRILQVWRGGMSFHGGMTGAIAACWIFGRRRGISLVALSDLVVLWTPVGLFLGRVGNFINGELYGGLTNGRWGVVFPGDVLQLPRHPSQLYEALLEGVLLFAVLWWVSRKPRARGFLSGVFLLGYAVVRLGVEFIRLPDEQLGYLFGFVTMGQLLSIPMLIWGGGWLLLLQRRAAAG